MFYGYESNRSVEKEIDETSKKIRETNGGQIKGQDILLTSNHLKNTTLSRETYHLLQNIFGIREVKNLCMNLKMKSMLVTFLLNFSIPWYSYKNLKLNVKKLNVKNCCGSDLRFEDKIFEMDVTKPLKSMSEKSDWKSLFLSAIVARKVNWTTTMQNNPELETNQELTEILEFLHGAGPSQPNGVAS